MKIWLIFVCGITTAALGRDSGTNQGYVVAIGFFLMAAAERISEAIRGRE